MVHAFRRQMIFLLVSLAVITTSYSRAQDSKQSTGTAPANQLAVTNGSVLGPMLTTLGEPSLFEAANDATARSFRVTFFSPVPVHEVAVRLTVKADGTGQITSAVSSGSETGVKRTTNDVSKADVDRLLELVDRAGFWAIPSEEPEPVESGRRYYVLDGFWWVLEGAKNGSFHYVFRRNPKPTAVTEIGCYLAKQLVDSYVVPMAPCGKTIAAPKESLYFKALSASIIEMEKSYAHQVNSDLEVRTDYHHVLVERDLAITDDLPNQFGDYRVEYLERQDVVARCKQLRKPFAILKIFPMINDGPGLKITINVYWASYKKGRLELGLSDWSEVELDYSCEKQSFVISKVKLGGI